jgi:DNA polymerase III delta subunit
VTSSPLRSPVTLIHGDSQLGISERVNDLRRAMDPTGLSTSLFDNARDSLGEVAAAAGSPGFFGSTRLVIARNLITGAPRRGRGRRAGESDDQLDFLGRVPAGVFLALVEGTVAPTEIKRLRSIAPDLSAEQYDVPRGKGLTDWVIARAEACGATIDQRTATMLVEALFPGVWRAKSRRDDVPPDLYRLASEIAKLSTAASPENTITPDVVSALTPDAESLNIWGLSNAIADRNPGLAILELERALENAQAPEVILGQLTAQFETFAVLVSGQTQSVESLASLSGLSEGRLRQASRAARQFRRSDVAGALAEIRRVDFGTKQGLLEPRDALPWLVTRLSQRSRA